MMNWRSDEGGAARRALWAAAIAGALVSACGGESRPDAEEPSRDPEPQAASETEMVPEHRWVEIKHIFERRRPYISRCFSEAIDAGELSDDDRGYITIGLTITEAGTATDLEILEATLESQYLHDCALQKVGDWEFGELPREVAYSFSYQLETL